MESKLSDRDLEVLLDIYSKHETLEEKLIYDMAIELKTYRDLEKHGVLVRADCAKIGKKVSRNEVQQYTL